MKSFNHTALVRCVAVMPLSVVQFLQVPSVALGYFTDAVFFPSFSDTSASTHSQLYKTLIESCDENSNNKCTARL